MLRVLRRKTDETVKTYLKEKAKEAALQSAKGIRVEHRRLIENGKQMLKSLSLSCWKSFLDECKLVARNKCLYLLLTFKPLHNLHLGNLKLVKQCTIVCHLSNRLKKNPKKTRAKKKTAKIYAKWPFERIQLDICRHRKEVLLS